MGLGNESCSSERQVQCRDWERPRNSTECWSEANTRNCGETSSFRGTDNYDDADNQECEYEDLDQEIEDLCAQAGCAPESCPEPIPQVGPNMC